MRKVYFVTVVCFGKDASRRYYRSRRAAFKYLDRVVDTWPESYVDEIELDK